MFSTEFLILGFMLLVFIAIFIFLGTSLFRVGEKEYALINWRFFLSPRPPAGNFIALVGEQGIWARVYGPGVHFIPFVKMFGEITRWNLFTVPVGRRGLVIARDGEPLGPRQIMTERPIVIPDILDGDAFLRSGGQRGPQLNLLPPGDYTFNHELFEIRLIDPVIITAVEKELEEEIKGEKRMLKREVPRFGLVTVKIGRELEEKGGRILAERPRLNAYFSTHDNFQDLAAFLAMGGQKGVQEEILEPGAYIINPEAVNVKQIEAEFISAGFVGVVISSAGSEPSEDELEILGTQNGRQITVLREKVDDRLVIDRRGILPKPLGPGFHFVHPVAQRLIRVDMTPRTICWDDQEETEFDPILVYTKDGFDFHVQVEVGIRVVDAPRFIAVSGKIGEFVNDTVSPQLNDIILSVASRKEVYEFFEKRADIVGDVLKQLRAVINEENFFAKILFFRIKKIDVEEHTALAEYLKLRTGEVNARREEALVVAQTKVAGERVKLQRQNALAANQTITAVAELNTDAAELLKKAIAAKGEGLAAALKRVDGESWLIKVVQMAASDPDFLKNILQTFSPGGKPQ
ncbi:MAG: SPFH domain-containing protein [Patescibacteria group bacterium]|mgnify:CR=1 FL=1